MKNIFCNLSWQELTLFPPLMETDMTSDILLVEKVPPHQILNIFRPIVARYRWQRTCWCCYRWQGDNEEWRPPSLWPHNYHTRDVLAHSNIVRHIRYYLSGLYLTDSSTVTILIKLSSWTIARIKQKNSSVTKQNHFCNNIMFGGLWVDYSKQK